MTLLPRDIPRPIQNETLQYGQHTAPRCYIHWRTSKASTFRRNREGSRPLGPFWATQTGRRRTSDWFRSGAANNFNKHRGFFGQVDSKNPVASKKSKGFWKYRPQNPAVSKKPRDFRRIRLQKSHGLREAQGLLENSTTKNAITELPSILTFTTNNVSAFSYFLQLIHWHQCQGLIIMFICSVMILLCSGSVFC
jgi:hypothetical protein